MREWLLDLRYGARMIVKRPGTSAIAIIALALGIGLTTTMFSIVEGVLLRGLPFPESDRIMMIARSTVKEPTRRDSHPAHDFTDFRAQQKSFEALAGYYGQGITLTTENGFPERLRGLRMTPNTLAVLRVAPMIGRDFTEADAQPGAQPVVAHRPPPLADAVQERSERRRNRGPDQRHADHHRRRHAAEIRFPRGRGDLASG